MSWLINISVAGACLLALYTAYVFFRDRDKIFGPVIDDPNTLPESERRLFDVGRIEPLQYTDETREAKPDSPPSSANGNGSHHSSESPEKSETPT